MADMEGLFGSSDDEASSQGQNNDSSDNENEGSENNDNGSGDEHSNQGGEEEEDKRSEGSGGENEAAAGSDDERNSNSGPEYSQHGSDGEEASDKEVDEEENVKGESDEEAVENESDNENAAKQSDASEAESDQEQANEGSEQSNDAASDNNPASDNENEGDEDQNKVASGGESDGEREDRAGSDQEEDAEMASEQGNSDNEHSEHHEHSEDEEEKAANSEHENEEDTEKNAIAEDLFGDADDISSGSDNEGRAKASKKVEEGEEEEDEDHAERMQEEKIDEEEEERRIEEEEHEEAMRISPAPENEEEVPEEEPPPEETRIDVEIPRINTDLGKEIHFVKLPNFISVETRPFDHNTYEDEIDDDEVLDEEGRARLKLKVENTIRWRWGVDEDANPVKESNAKFIKWSDGSMSLHLGSEIFDVHKQLLQGDHNHLFIRQGTGLQGQAVFRTKLTFRPHSTDSFTHRKITMSVADRSQKTQKIRILPNVGKDPEAHRSEMIKKEEDRLKASIRRESKQMRMKERAISRGLSASYLEGDRYDEDDEDDDGAISLAAIKNKFKKGALRENRPPIYSSDSEGSEIDERRARRLEKAKTISESDDEGSGEEVGPKKKMARIEESDDD